MCQLVNYFVFCVNFVSKFKCIRDQNYASYYVISEAYFMNGLYEFIEIKIKTKFYY